MVTINGDNDMHPRISFALRISLGAIIAMIVQLVGLVAWLVSMHADINVLKSQHTAIYSRIDRMDIDGTRALGDVKKDIGQVQGANTIQDQRIIRNDNRIDELVKNQTEHKFWLDQAREFMRGSARP